MNLLLKSKYGSRRVEEYPTLEEQLDMLWHGMDKNPDKRVEPWYSLIRGIKEKNPKC